MKEYTSKERVIAALNHEEADRVPIDFGGFNNTTIHYKTQIKLLKHLGYDEAVVPEIKSQSQQVVVIDERILEHFKSDTRCIYLDESKVWEKDENGIYTDHFGIQYIDDGEMNFKNHYKSPLAQAMTIDDILAYELPNPRDPRIVAGLKERAAQFPDKALILDGLRGSTFELVSWIRGIQEFYIDLLINEDMAAALIDKVVEYEMELATFAYEELGDCIDIIRVADDLGTQLTTLISEEVYVNFIKPAQAKLYNHIKSTFKNAKLLLHCCGAVSTFIPHFIDIGVDALNPVQISATGMDAVTLKENFGDKITFWGGGIDTQTVLPKESPEVVKECAKSSLETFKPNGGYVFATVHNIMPEVPVENIAALFQAYDENSKY